MCREALPDARIVGVDPAPTMVQVALEKFADDPNVSFTGGVVEVEHERIAVSGVRNS